MNSLKIFRWVLILLDLYIVFVFVLDGLIYRTYGINGNENISVLVRIGVMFLVGLVYVMIERYLNAKSGSEKKLSIIAKIMLFVPASALSVVFLVGAYLTLLFGFIGPFLSLLILVLIVVVVKYATSGTLGVKLRLF